MLEHSRIALTESIDIDNGTEIIQFMMASNLGGFPHGSLDGFSIAHQDVGSVIEFVDIFCIESDSNTDWKALPQRTRRHIHKRQARRRMALKIRRQRSKFKEVTLRKKTCFRPRGIKQWSSMAF